MPIVTRFGLHKDEDEVWWLLQGRLAQNLNIYKLPSDQCPFEIDNKARYCHHNFTLDRSDLSPEREQAVRELYNSSELFRLMAPVPYKPEIKCVYVVVNNFDQNLVLNDALQTCCPTVNICKAMNTMRDTDTDGMIAKLRNSDLGRYLIIEASSNAPKRTENFINMTIGVNGRLFIAGDRRPFYGMNRLVEVLDFDPNLNQFANIATARAAGNFLVKEFMNGNEITSS